jgi:hypothetical protein
MFYHQNRSSEPQVWHLTQNSLAYHIEQLSMTIESKHPKSQYKSKSVRYTYIYIYLCVSFFVSLYIATTCGCTFGLLFSDVGCCISRLMFVSFWVLWFSFSVSLLSHHKDSLHLPTFICPQLTVAQLARLIPTTVEGIPVCSWDCWNMKLAMLCVHFFPPQ